MSDRQDTSSLFFHDGELQLVEKNGAWAIMLFIDGWYSERETADEVMRTHWQDSLNEERNA